MVTRFGPVDLCFEPAAFSSGYEELAPSSVVVTLSHLDIPVAALRDIVASKRAAGRPKDLVALPALEERLRRSSS